MQSLGERLGKEDRQSLGERLGKEGRGKLQSLGERLGELQYYYTVKCLLRLLERLESWESEWLNGCLTGNGAPGGLRNLLLDGWWLEFWDVVLLTDGDVERNPGPRRLIGRPM